LVLQEDLGDSLLLAPYQRSCRTLRGDLETPAPGPPALRRQLSVSPAGHPNPLQLVPDRQNAMGGGRPAAQSYREAAPLSRLTRVVAGKMGDTGSQPR